MIEAARRNRALMQMGADTEQFENYITDESALDRLIKARLGAGQ